MQISQLFMFQATHTWFIVAQVMSFGEWLSIIARSELGSDLDCSVINARSEPSSDLDCYELKAISATTKANDSPVWLLEATSKYLLNIQAISMGLVALRS